MFRGAVVCLAAVLISSVGLSVAEQVCVDCHKRVTPNIVGDWSLSLHASQDVDCSVCHGDEHTDRISLKTDDEIKALKEEGSGFGVASCDSCHTRHLFSANEARSPEACRTCHMGFDHPQWEMYSSSKHGVRYELKKTGTISNESPGPVCQDCHMQAGNHEVRTSWGFLAIRLPLPEDEQWKADQMTILQALGVPDPEGKPAEGRQHDQGRRSPDGRGDPRGRGSLREGVLPQPESYAYAFPDLLTFHDAPTPVEQRLFVMFLKHRMRAFQGTFHANPDYALWYGWSEMKQDLAEIRAKGRELRERKASSL